MLILSRFENQSFYLFLEDGTEIQIKLLDIFNSYSHSVAKIGIQAPKNVNIVREELIQRALEEEIMMEEERMKEERILEERKYEY